MHPTPTEPALGALLPFATDRLRLRPLTLVDAEAFCAMTDAPGITEVVDFLPTSFTLADATRLITGQGDGRTMFWVLFAERERRLIGTIGTHLVGEQIEIGYWLAPAHHGRGLALEALSGLLPILRAANPRCSIFAECRPRNADSWRLLERTGFVPDGHDGKRDGRKRLVLTAWSQGPDG